MCKYCARTRKWHIFFHTKFYISHFLNCASENMKLFSNFSSNYSLVLCLFPLFFSNYSLVLCLFPFFFFHFVKLRNLRFHLIFLTKKLSTIKLLFDLIIFFVVIPIWAKVHPRYEYDSQWFKNKIKLLQWEENISEKI